MSSTIVIWPIIKALCMASQFIGINPIQWCATNSTQHIFLENHFSKRDEAWAFGDNEMRAWASTHYEELNRILRQESFSIQLAPFPQSQLGVVSILDVAVEWKEQGTKTTLVDKSSPETIYPAVEMDTFLVYETPTYKQPIVCIKTKTNDTVFMTIADHAEPLNDFALLQWIQALKKERVPSNENYSSVVFPMIDLNQAVDISWLVNMAIADWYIAQALQQTKFKMNEKGAHVKSAVAIGLLRTSYPIIKEPLKLIIDKPFYIWIERPGVTDPIFAGYMSHENWKDPQNLTL